MNSAYGPIGTVDWDKDSGANPKHLGQDRSGFINLGEEAVVVLDDGGLWT